MREFVVRCRHYFAAGTYSMAVGTHEGAFVMSSNMGSSIAMRSASSVSAMAILTATHEAYRAWGMERFEKECHPFENACGSLVERT